MKKEIHIPKEKIDEVAHLKNSKDFHLLKELAEMILQARAWQLVERNDTIEEKKEELADISGAYNFWLYITNLIERVNTHSKENETDKKTN